MTNNPAQALRLLITYAVCIPLAITVGWMITDPMDYGTMGIFAIIAMTLMSPFVIKWYYPLLVFGLASPIHCFFLPGRPPLGQVVVLLCLGIALINRAINSEKRFISVPLMTWPLLYTIAMAYTTAKLTGGIGLHSVGGDVGGGQKYIALFCGCLTYFALTSYRIPKERRGFYMVIFFLPGILGLFGDLFPYLPSPLNYINLLIPPSLSATNETAGAITRLAAFANAAGACMTYLLAKYGLRGIFRGDKPVRFLFFAAFSLLTLTGGFRIVFVSYGMTLILLFFLEELHRTRLVLVFAMLVIVGLAVIYGFGRDLPMSFQRALTVMPFVKLDPVAVADAQDSKQWREDMWRDVWPKVPQYFFLGKGYALRPEDFQYMGGGAFDSEGGLDKSDEGLAISMDYHNGPLSTLMPFGIWGMIAYLWLATASLWVTYRNYRYGDPEIKTVNAYLFVAIILHVFGYFFLFGAFATDLVQYMELVGFSVALNWGLRGPKPVSRVNVIQAKAVRVTRALPA